jgi:hypothetical protein
VTNGKSRPHVQHISGFGIAREAAEEQLDRDGIILPFPQRAQWHRALGEPNSALVVAADDDGVPKAAAGISIGRSRALPLHSIYRVERLAASADDILDASLLHGIADAARRDPRCIRLHVGIFERNAERRSRLGAMMLQAGFVKARLPESYGRTPSLDLEASEEELFLKVAPSARRNVRAPAKRGLEMQALHDPIYAARIEELMRESFQRTGGSAVRLPWRLILQCSDRSPNRSRIVGLFEPNNRTPNGLVAFAWGCVNGSYVSYEAAASTRRTEMGNLALAYAPLWDLILWAKRLGATWFDFGGVPAVDRVPDDPLGGIADFKRFFCEDIMEVRDEWTLEPRPFRASVARAMSVAVERMRRYHSAAPVAAPPQAANSLDMRARRS